MPDPIPTLLVHMKPKTFMLFFKPAGVEGARWQKGGHTMGEVHATADAQGICAGHCHIDFVGKMK